MVRAQFPRANSSDTLGNGFWSGNIGDGWLRLLGSKTGSTRQVEKIPRRIAQITDHPFQTLAVRGVRDIKVQIMYAQEVGHF